MNFWNEIKSHYTLKKSITKKSEALAMLRIIKLFIDIGYFKKYTQKGSRKFHIITNILTPTITTQIENGP